MSLDKFLIDPWGSLHDTYKESPFHIRPAPEFCTAEVMVASLYRATGFPSYPESEVPKAGREFDRASRANQVKIAGRVSPDTWRTILHEALESPKQPNQSAKRFLQLTPVVPDAALYSGSARLAGNPWNPGALVTRMIQLGTPGQEEANALWDKLYAALSISGQDDVWARWLQDEFVQRKKSGPAWQQAPLIAAEGLPASEKVALRYPAKQFVRDLDAIIDAKHCMTRRQWVSLLESLLRLASVAHVLWLCRTNDRIWRAVGAQLGIGQGQVPRGPDEVRELLLAGEGNYLSYGNPAIPTIKDYASRYLLARLGLNLVLWHLDKAGYQVKQLQSAKDVWTLLQATQEYKAHLESKNILDHLHDLQDHEAKTVACKKGIGSNMVEFARHVLGQRLTTNEALRGYDQGYFLRKRGDRSNAPWILSLGPVAVLSVVHCCLREVNGPRSVKRLADHLAWYGMQVDLDDINASDLGKNLRMLGLVLDSPDAESGMLLVQPFGTTNAKVKI